jgi:excisionase family DNA binding protein
MEGLLKGKQVAELLQISESQAYTLMREEIPVVRLGRSVRVRTEDLEKYICSKLVAPETRFMLQFSHRA